ncbi:MAG: hypothetical protein J2P58_03020 [Acidimicrobiaceae bacterium]|nr:hypothetical protein [Acidimicrobiaceae bacterium]
MARRIRSGVCRTTELPWRGGQVPGCLLPGGAAPPSRNERRKKAVQGAVVVAVTNFDAEENLTGVRRGSISGDPGRGRLRHVRGRQRPWRTSSTISCELARNANPGRVGRLEGVSMDCSNFGRRRRI